MLPVVGGGVRVRYSLGVARYEAIPNACMSLSCLFVCMGCYLSHCVQGKVGAFKFGRFLILDTYVYFLAAV